MGFRAQAAEEMLGGIYAALNGRVPNTAILAKIEELEEVIEADSDTHCYCGAAHHGGDCMCNE